MMRKCEHLLLNASLLIKRYLVAGCAGVNLASTCEAAHGLRVGNSSAVLTVAKRGAATTVMQILISVRAFVIR